MPKSLYIHIPFCRSKCLYCDFYSQVYDPDLAAAYVAALCRQIKELDQPLASIYIGGGTPTVLDTDLLKKLLRGLEPFSGNREFTCEANPESLTKEKLALLKSAGVNRLSLGVQSFSDSQLKKLGRIHSAKDSLTAIKNAAKAGFIDLSLDLIFGVWEQSFAQWQAELAHLPDLPLAHVSCYSLTYEKKTPLYQRLQQKTFVPVPDALSAKMYKYAVKYLAKIGFKRYEVSNFSCKGHECRHNLRYWENEPYIGLGPSAVSYLNGVRQQNVLSVKEYITKVTHGQNPVVFKEKLSKSNRAKEAAALKIRTAQGIGLEWFRDKFGCDLAWLEKESLPELISNGLVSWHNDKTVLRLTSKGFLFCDTVSAAFL